MQHQDTILTKHWIAPGQNLRSSHSVELTLKDRKQKNRRLFFRTRDYRKIMQVTRVWWCQMKNGFIMCLSYKMWRKLGRCRRMPWRWRRRFRWSRNGWRCLRSWPTFCLRKMMNNNHELGLNLSGLISWWKHTRVLKILFPDLLPNIKDQCHSVNQHQTNCTPLLSSQPTTVGLPKHSAQDYPCQIKLKVRI